METLRDLDFSWLQMLGAVLFGCCAWLALYSQAGNAPKRKRG